MGQPTVFNELVIFQGGIQVARDAALPAESIGGAKIKTTDPIPASKLEGEYRASFSQSGTVANATYYLGIVRGDTGDVIQVEAAITETIATGADRTVTIDILKSTGGGAFATILSAPIVLDDGSTIRTSVEAALAAGAALVDGDILKATVAVAGVAGNQALGLAGSVTWREDAD